MNVLMKMFMMMLLIVLIVVIVIIITIIIVIIITIIIVIIITIIVIIITIIIITIIIVIVFIITIIIVIIITIKIIVAGRLSAFESNLENNFRRKNAKDVHLVKELRNTFKKIEFINLSASSFGIFSKYCSSFFKMLDNLQVSELQNKHCVRRIVNIARRMTYILL